MHVFGVLVGQGVEREDGVGGAMRTDGVSLLMDVSLPYDLRYRTLRCVLTNGDRRTAALAMVKLTEPPTLIFARSFTSVERLNLHERHFHSDRKSTRLNSSHRNTSRMPSSA